MERMIKEYAQRVVLVFASVLLVGCSHSEKDFVTEDGKVEVTKAIDFKVDFLDVDSTEEVTITRANGNRQSSDTLSHQLVDLGNHLLAEITVQRNVVKTLAKPKAQTRALNDGTYILTAVDPIANKPVGSVKGVVSNGTFIPENNAMLELSPGTYKFVLIALPYTGGNTSYVVDNSNPSNPVHTLSMTVNDNVRLGIAKNIVITSAPRHQQVKFDMKDPCAKMGMQLLTSMPFESPGYYKTLQGKIEGTIPLTGKMDIALDDGVNGTNPTAFSHGCDFQPVSQVGIGEYQSNSNNDFSLFRNTAVSQFRLVLNNGWIYHTNLSLHPTTINLTPSTPVLMQANNFYRIKVKLMYNCWYLMSDGTIGLTGETTYGGGTKTPVALVLSRSKRIAITLEDAYGGNRVKWANVATQFDNNTAYTTNNYLTDMDGYHYTWEASGSKDGVTIKGNEPTHYPAFYYAGHYGAELETALAAKGIALVPNLKNGKWYLPSVGEWNLLNNLVKSPSSHNFDSNFCRMLFSQVGGDSPAMKSYWNSTENFYNQREAFCAGVGYLSREFGVKNKDFPSYIVRPFIKY